MRCTGSVVASSRNYEIRPYFAKKLRGRQREPGILAKTRVKLADKQRMSLTEIAECTEKKLPNII